MQHLEEVHGHRVQPVQLLDGDQYTTDTACTFNKFHEFPRTKRWRICEDYSLVPHEDVTNPAQPRPPDLGSFLQSWLWFGLLYTVVQNRDGPLLTYRDLVEPGGQNVTSKHLNDKLKEWRRFVVGEAKDDPDVARIRMIRVEIVLQIARSVMRKNCAVPDWESAYAEAPGQQIPQVDDYLALSLMVLGETLASTKISIMEEAGLRIPGWHSEDLDEGWGPSRAVCREMGRSKWCLRTVHILQSQLKGHATLMYCASLLYRDSTQMARHRDYIERHSSDEKKACTKDICMFKAEQEGQYRTQHAPTCRNQADCDRRGMLGPDMTAVMLILARASTSNEIPLVTIIRDAGAPTPITLDVTSFNPAIRDPKPYATLSHVWSDGWGNELSNKLHTCQLDYIYTMLERGNRRHRGDENGQTKFTFWMDTLVIPVHSRDQDLERVMNRDPVIKRVMQDRALAKRQRLANAKGQIRELKAEAIAQIHRVFSASEFTIVLDNGVSDMSPQDNKPCESAIRILASGWMKRLWTLQEAFLSERIYIPFRHPGHGNYQPIKELDGLFDNMNSSEHGHSGVVQATKRHLSEGLMNADRRSQIDQMRRRKGNHDQEPDVNKVLLGYSLIANAWRAARWRVSFVKDSTQSRAVANMGVICADHGQSSP